jgi:hypothetical protein
MATTQQSIDKLNKYTERLELLNKQLEDVNKNTKEYKRLTAEKNKVEQKAEKASKELSNAQGKLSSTLKNHKPLIDKANNAQKRFNKTTSDGTKVTKGFFSKLKTAIGTLSRYALAYGLINTAQRIFSELTVKAFKRAVNLEKALADVAAIAGLTSSEMLRLKNTVFEVAGVTSLTATEVVELQKQLAKLGTSVSDIEKLTEPVAILSQALGEEPGGVAATLKKTLNQFQATTEEANRFSNALVGAVNETALSLNDLGTALQYVGPLAAQSGVSFEQTSSLLGILADNGFRASRAGTGLRNVLLEAAKSGKPVVEFLEELSEKNLDVAKATEIFGKRGASAAIVLSNNIDKFKQLSVELEDSSRLFSANAKQMSSTQGQLDLLSSAYDKFSTKIGEAFIKTELFIGLLGILDGEAAATARAYKAIANASGDAADAIEELVVSQRNYNEGVNRVVPDIQILNTAFDALGNQAEVSKEKFINAFQQEIEKTGDLREALINLTWNPTWTGEIEQAAGAILKLLKLTGDRSKGLDNLYIAQEANNDIVKKFNSEYAELSALTKSGVEVDNESLLLKKQIGEEIEKLGKETFELGKKGKDLNKDDKESFEIITKRIAILKELQNSINGLSVDEDTLADKRKKADKEEQGRLKTELSDYIERIKETEKVIGELRVEVGESAFPTQVDLLDGFFGGAEDVIAEATKRFGADSKFVKDLVKTLRDTADEVSIQLPKEVGETIDLAAKGVFGVDGVDLAQLELAPIFAPEKAKSLADKIREAFKDVKLADVIAEGLDKAAESIAEFNAVALENTKGRLEAEKSAISNRYETENDILKSQLDNQLITESQFRVKQQELQRAKIAEENDIDKKIFEAEKKQDRQNATTDYLQSLASIIPNLIIYDKEGNPVKLAIKSAISAGLTTAAYGAELAAIGQKKFFPKKFAEGGMVSGPSHDQGGVPFSVQGQSGYEMEGGEYVINKRATAMHRDLLDRINKSGMTRPRAGSYKFAEGGLVSSPLNESVDYLKAIAEATTSTAIGVSKPVRAYVADKDLRTDSTERRIRDRNDRI